MSAKKKTDPNEETLISHNTRSARRFEIEDRLETGIVLVGSELKSMRRGACDLEGSYATIEKRELFLHKMHVAAYEFATQYGHEPSRSRKLLAHRHQIEKWTGRVAHRGYVIIPLRVYFKAGRVKVELGLGKKRDGDDKRHAIREEESRREAKAAMEKGRR